MPRWIAVAVATWMGLGSARADRIVLKDGRSIFGTILKEGDVELRYRDRFGRPRKLPSPRVDSLVYDLNRVAGRVEAAFRKGQPTDQSGFVRLKHSEELDLDVVYRTDSAAELDLFFKNRAQVRILPGSTFQVLKAPKGLADPVEIALMEGDAMVAGHGPKTVVRVKTPAAIAVGRGQHLIGIRYRGQDSSLVTLCLKGLAGIQEREQSPGELAAEPLKALSFSRKEGVFHPEEPDSAVVEAMRLRSQDMLRYRFESVENPPIGYLPRALTGLGFLVFFYGASLGILDYVNHI